MRSMLFVPGDSPRKFEKASQGAADALIIDLEDSVVADRKDEARGMTRTMLDAPRGKPQLYVRVNALDTGRTLGDLAAVMPARPDGIVLPKSRGGDDVRMVALWLDAFEAAAGLTPGSTRIVVVATETAGSIFGLGSYKDCSPRLAGLMWGAEDLAASLGATENGSGGVFHSPYRLARDLCLMGAAAAEVSAIDTVYTDIDNLAGLEQETRAARRDGFTCKALIHPKHVDIVNAAFAPTAAERGWAEKVVAAFAENPGAGTLRLDGKMLDKPHLRAAQRILGT
ncbi:HpcH/HpaI aldolase/citrate lyase family protein [Rhodopseudomonas pseudopalustris]|uniref:Citrate lyase subunit beta / citryl-CoA lyase n=1 Tax=Rhodopseudomonas pseudopalustris TaxID=1513892 RepID=A0A1H8WAK8_9BRAD|nr:CoA ester lyase [Rhodopseudomonas pseudopalustris]SEP24178.1 citrate lyase subunit beta / citryl-CoA lyase [Rhodopseudomonas pseudopalustris]